MVGSESMRPSTACSTGRARHHVWSALATTGFAAATHGTTDLPPIECPPGTQPGRELNSGRDFLKNSLAEESRRAEMLEKTRLDPRQDAQQRSPDEGSSMP